jgi:AAA family ATP:ADP antiporter
MATSYYVFSEMFGSFILVVCFWQLVNFYSSHNQAKRIYAYYGLWAQIGNYAAGSVMVHISTILKQTGDMNNNVFLVTSAVMFGSCIVLATLFYFFNVGLKNYKKEESVKKETKPKIKVHWKDSLKDLSNNPALLLTAFLSVWYGLCATSMEVYWKGKVVQYYGNHGYGIFMGNYQRYTAMVSFVMGLLGASFIRNLPWLAPALFTPLIVMLSSTLLFGIKLPFVKVILGKILNFSPEALQDEMLYITVIIGAAALIMFKAFKYTLFDSTKEMFTRSRSADEAIKIKSLETFVGRFGKGGSSIIQSIILSIPGMTMDGMSPLLWCMTILMSGIWTYSIAVPLNKEMKLVEAKAATTK